MKNNKIQIIAGKWKGRKIPIINQLTVRPTSSRIRETLFNWLNPIITNTTCLDCFTGSGALGLESLSRGAKKVTCIDKDIKCITLLKKTVKKLNNYNKNIEIIYSDCRNWLQNSNNTYDIIFIDPPFSKASIIPEIILLLEKNNHFKKKSWIYLEIPKKNFLNFYNFPKSWLLYRQKSTKSLSIFLYHRNQ